MAFEGIEFEFTRNGLTLPVTQFLPGEGVILGGETDNWPLGVALRLEPTSPGTRVRWEQIQRNEGWLGDNTFQLNLSKSGELLRYEGIRPTLLPSGSYRASIFVSGYRFHTRIFDFTVPDNGSVQLKVPEAPEHRHVQPSPVPPSDVSTNRILAGSTLDGAALATWLDDPTRRDARKACVLNLLAKLRSPIAGQAPLSEGILRVFFADIDRVYAELAPGFVERLKGSTSGFTRDHVVDTTHLRLLKRIPNGSAYHLQSFRERVDTSSMQLAVAVPDSPTDPQFADIDIDLGNPFASALGFFIHVGELIDPGKTDHLKLFSALDKLPWRDFLYYRLNET